ncbi:hypothetical protein SISSUDRAFT_1045121 [Sistotremastrum suecicum HHB10207 ss-3]|uniref:Uncharacterized protein n=1 Tax=Sistotremastrum suecicum HHB10207 ss-3 TaxID=1314776 RepID=A0A166EPC3_9AGAM|nr:hypothetical protein SISSUDRAFT_1045121 [Sistotremastrum suecicum HHB10207 ss-3]
MNPTVSSALHSSHASPSRLAFSSPSVFESIRTTSKPPKRFIAPLLVFASTSWLEAGSGEPAVGEFREERDARIERTKVMEHTVCPFFLRYSTSPAQVAIDLLTNLSSLALRLAISPSLL